MSGNTEADTKEVDVTETVTDTESGEDLAAQVEKWKALSRKNEARAKENAEKALKFDEIESASKSDLEKAQDALAQAEARVAERDAKLARLEAIAEYGLAEADAQILALVPAEKVSEVAEQLAARGGHEPNPLVVHLGRGGSPIPPKGDDKATVNALIRAARN